MTIIFYLRPNVNSFTGYKYALPGAQRTTVVPDVYFRCRGRFLFIVLLPVLLLVYDHYRL